MSSILDEARMISGAIARKYKPEKIILFGSTARGNARADSDIDLLIIKPSKKKKAYRIKEVFETLRDTPRTHALDPLVYTPEELQMRLSLGDMFLTRVLNEGTLLYG